MIAVVKYALLVPLLLLLYMVIQRMLMRMIGTEHRGLIHGRRNRIALRGERGGVRYARLLAKHLGDLLRSARLSLTVESFVLISLLLGSAGAAAGMLYFVSVKGVAILGLFLLLMPYLWLRSRLIGMQVKHRFDLLPAIESFYQRYVLSESKNIVTVLHSALDGRHIPASLEPIFRQLYAGLMMHRERDDCLRVFTQALGGRWAEHLAAMFGYAAQDGTDISDGLRELITDMRHAIRTDHADRNRLLEIRIANFSPIVFLVVFIAVNYHMNPEQTYYYYMITEEGRNMLLDALALIGASFGMGLYLSMRKI